MTLSALDEERAKLQAQINDLIRKAPPSFGDWNWNRTRQFLDASEAASRLLRKKKPPTADLTQTLTTLRGFWL